MIGTVLGNRYELLDKVGVGGMAVVYKATDRLLNRNVAVKLLRSEFQGNEEFIRRFNIESQAAASLSHANIVSIYDVGQSNGLEYIVMEFVEGRTLKEYIAEKKSSIYWKDATNIAMQICSALEHAHSKHIIHRDIKPQNIMITSDGTVKVTDFGIARAASGGTTTMDAMGSAHYLSPEQARGGYTDQKSDIYSLGVVLYELFTGKLPFDGDTPVAVAMQHMQAEPIRPRVLKADIPKAVENIILKAMSKEQRLRYENASQMLADIKKAYADPESVIKVTEDQEAEKFGTKKIPPIVNITMPTDTNKPVVRRNEEDRIKKPKKSNKNDTVAIVVAIITCVIIACAMGIFAASCMNNRANQEQNQTTNDGVYHMPNVTSLSKTQMEESLKPLRDANFAITLLYEYHPTIPKGDVITQIPSMGPINEDTEIIITISNGTETVNLDDYTNQPAEEVTSILEAKGIVVILNPELSDDVEEGNVIRHLPSVGQNVKTGDTVRLFVSSGPNVLELGDYTGMDVESAKESLENMGIEVKVEDAYSDTLPVGTIVRQSPEEGTETKKGDTVVLYVSQGPELMTVPDLLVGYDLDTARDVLTNNNLELGQVKEITSGKPAGTVVKQSIPAGSKVEKGTAIDISISRTETATEPPAVVVAPQGEISDTGL